MAGPFPPTFASCPPGARINVVGRLKCWDSSHEHHLFQSMNDKVTFQAVGLIDGSTELYTFMNATMKSQYPMPVVLIDDQTRVFRHEPPSWDSVHAVVELCAGFGGMSQGLSASGFHTVAAVDFNDKMCHLFSKQCEAETIVGNVTDLDTVCRLWHVAKGAGTISAGFACQPFSNLGDRRGSADSRSLSLRGILEIGFFMQVQAVILECVSPAAMNQYVKDEIAKFCEVMGFFCSQTELHLHDVWPSRRSRSWWLLTSSFIGHIPLTPWPKSHVVQKVMQVFPGILPWNETDENALLLSPEELVAFGADSEMFARFLLNFEGCAPCALHAWGSQVVGCLCGCRSTGLSPFRLQEKGLFGLVFSALFTDERKLRHIHPNECNALNGFDPVLDFESSPRLTLSASGQMASPLQTAWVFATLAERIQQMKQTQKIFSPNAMLQALISWTLMRCRQVWPCETEPIQDANICNL